ncbi:hypothetical protein E4U43_001883 [Claviceps pusilla]|uniref:Uncharacterized protein n=1 Tax=Claviceps pusilla TaxID=123648 RepID=A0A9P7NGY6_9HYPO|nr:hypothetical protein E4U43_001883 [Claviceps pusilla]
MDKQHRRPKVARIGGESLKRRGSDSLEVSTSGPRPWHLIAREYRTFSTRFDNRRSADQSAKDAGPGDEVQLSRVE